MFYIIREDDAVSMLAMNAQRGVDIEQYSLLNSALNGGGCQLHTLATLPSGKVYPDRTQQEAR